MKKIILILTALCAITSNLQAQVDYDTLSEEELKGSWYCRSYHPDHPTMMLNQELFINFMPYNIIIFIKVTNIINPEIANFKSSHTGKWQIENEQIHLTELKNKHKKHQFDMDLVYKFSEDKTLGLSKKEIRNLQILITEKFNEAIYHFEVPVEEFTLHFISKKDNTALFGIKNASEIGFANLFICGKEDKHEHPFN